MKTVQGTRNHHAHKRCKEPHHPSPPKTSSIPVFQELFLKRKLALAHPDVIRVKTQKPDQSQGLEKLS